MKFKQGLLLFLITASFYGCAPANTETPVNTSITLPTRPQIQADIFSRSLLYKNDPRVSYCEIVENQQASYSGMRDTQLEPLASLSKLITSVWALDQLGADYRFQSEWFLKPVPGRAGYYDAYLKTNFDPAMTIEKILYHLSELSKTGVKGLRELRLDESTRVYLSVLSQPHIELNSVPVLKNESQENLKLILNSKNWSTGVQKARRNLALWAQKNNRQIQIPSSFSVEQVMVSSPATTYPIQKIIQSAPLFKYLKNINVYSNNYLSDALFAKLGGVDAFRLFQKNNLQLSSKELQIYTGSGLATVQNGLRQDNLGSCFSMIKILSYLKQKSAGLGLNLGHLLLNPTQDSDGTFSATEDYENSVVLKTGRLFENPAMNLAGFVATERGVLSFVFLGHDFSEAEARQIEDQRAEMLSDIQRKYRPLTTYLTLKDYDILFE